MTLKFALNKPVANAVLVSDDGQNVPLSMTVDDPHDYMARLPMRESRHYTLQLTDTEGRSNKRPPLISLNSLPNHRPDIQLTFPGRDLRVSPLEEMLSAARSTTTSAWSHMAWPIRSAKRSRRFSH